MSIAHRTPIAVDPKLALSWGNLLGSCDGGRRSGDRYRSCDAAQGDRPLTVDPTRPESVARLTYDRRDNRSGSFITSEDLRLRQDVEVTLALNSGDLPELREAAWKAFRDRHRSLNASSYGKPALQQFLPNWLAQYGNVHPEFVGFVEWKLR